MNTASSNAHADQGGGQAGSVAMPPVSAALTTFHPVSSQNELHHLISTSNRGESTASAGLETGPKEQIRKFCGKFRKMSVDACHQCEFHLRQKNNKEELVLKLDIDHEE